MLPSPTLPRTAAPPSLARGAFAMGRLTYHAAVREIRRTHGNAALGLLSSILQNVMLLVVFYLTFTLLGTRHIAIRGDFVLYLLSGIFPFMVHAKAMGAVVKAEGPTSPMMQHAPLNPYVTMAAAALASLYIQVLSLVVILFLYHALWTPIAIDQPVGALAMLLLAWFSGVAVGVCLAALKPWFPDGAALAASVYARVNVIASGKMFVANSLPGAMLPIFDWNPLFHVIDQSRGYIFLNYFPHFSDWRYALAVAATVLAVGLMGQAHTRRHASLSWSQRR